ncbi:hypothetical protein [Frankia sp. Cj3]|uniref:hypothetical protein n=1 Tax=Frankia sp. Cj3 TaxID=2880976 RepID=UPI001EF4811B|nr:hypothetical protein [Frankia sp. Cj3]
MSEIRISYSITGHAAIEITGVGKPSAATAAAALATIRRYVPDPAERDTLAAMLGLAGSQEAHRD